MRFLLHIAICHEDMMVDPDSGQYHGSSPDEKALVNAAAQFKFKFIGTEFDVMSVHDEVSDEMYKFKVLHTCSFSSARKRMSIVVKEMQGEERILLLCKGADSVILRLLKSGQDELVNETTVNAENFANDGLRVLMFGQRELEPGIFTSW